jgi:hypothetical protein
VIELTETLDKKGLTIEGNTRSVQYHPRTKVPEATMCKLSESLGQLSGSEEREGFEPSVQGNLTSEKDTETAPPLNIPTVQSTNPVPPATQPSAVDPALLCVCGDARRKHVDYAGQLVCVAVREPGALCPCLDFDTPPASESPRGPSAGGPGAQPPSDRFRPLPCFNRLSKETEDAPCTMPLGHSGWHADASGAMWEPGRGYWPADAEAPSVDPDWMRYPLCAPCASRLALPREPSALRVPARCVHCGDETRGAQLPGQPLHTEVAPSGATPASGDDCRKCGQPIAVKHLAVRNPGGAWEHFLCPDLPYVKPTLPPYDPAYSRRATRDADRKLAARRAAVASLLPNNLQAVAAEIARVSQLRTSELLRLVASWADIDATSHRQSADMRPKYAAVANELRVRAGEIERLGDHLADCEDHGRLAVTTIEQMLRQIGEVRS